MKFLFHSTHIFLVWTLIIKDIINLHWPVLSSNCYYEKYISLTDFQIFTRKTNTGMRVLIYLAINANYYKNTFLPQTLSLLWQVTHTCFDNLQVIMNLIKILDRNVYYKEKKKLIACPSHTVCIWLCIHGM